MNRPISVAALLSALAWPAAASSPLALQPPLEQAARLRLEPFRPSPRPGLRLSPSQAEAIARLIWRNEGGGRIEALTTWNHGESFASLGVGHFIWYPAGEPATFTESFPELLSFLVANGVALPGWLAQARHCPWPDRASFEADFNGMRLCQLRALLAATFALQARFIANRCEAALPRIVEGLPATEQAEIRGRYQRVASCANGVYGLVDYVNFKGEGVSPLERYNGAGWGLLQVLQEMREVPPGRAAAREFSNAAERVLRRRVAHAPPQRREERWLPGWLNRIATYKDALTEPGF